MKKTLLIFITVTLTACASYYDDYGNIEDPMFKLEIAEESNTFSGLERMAMRRDQEKYYPQKFDILLPKKIKYFSIYSNYYIFEYYSKQIIVVDPGYENHNKQSDNWILRDPKFNEVHNSLYSHWNDRNYSDNILYKQSQKRITKVYTNGEVRIILFNIKSQNFENYLNKVKNFVYVDSVH